MKNQFLLYEQTKYIFLNPTLSESSDSILEFFNFSVADFTKFPYGETCPSFSLIFFSKIKYLWKLFFKKRIQFLFVDPKSDWILCALYVQEVFWICNAFLNFRGFLLSQIKRQNSNAWFTFFKRYELYIYTNKKWNLY